ncbi:hypothetical protein ERO13_A11G250520v2 [Gossypium hirsutum]|nr:hypothetical protein ERO13_A11G250520v2 [Gossypium hirsutum]
MQPGAGHYMQHQQAQQMTQQSLMAARSSMLYSQQPFSALQQQQQQALHSQLGMSSGGSTGLHMLQTESSTAGGSGALGAGGFPDLDVVLLEKASMVAGQWQVEASKISGVPAQLKVVEEALVVRVVVMGVKPFT